MTFVRQNEILKPMSLLEFTGVYLKSSFRKEKSQLTSSLEQWRLRLRLRDSKTLYVFATCMCTQSTFVFSVLLSEKQKAGFSGKKGLPES